MNEPIIKTLIGGKTMTEPEVWELFESYGLPVPRHRLVRNEDEAVLACESIGYPVVLKIVSPDILHKSDAGGVKVNLRNKDDMLSAYHDILANIKANRPGAEIVGILAAEMLPQGVECIIGMTEDASFGPAIMFGLGGIFVEVLKDVSFRVLPVDKKNALDMIGEIKGSAILRGIRGQKPKDIDAMADLIVKVAALLEANPAIRELDINPCFIYENGVMPADARIIL
jgi:acetyl-CoA synthetase (ADP-forming)